MNNDSENKSIYDKIRKIENVLGFVKSTIYDSPFLLVTPSTFVNKCDWQNLLTHYQFDDVAELLKKGIVPLNRQLLAEKTLTDIFEEIAPNDCEHLLLDTGYGIVIFPENCSMKNLSLNLTEIERYTRHIPPIKQFPSDIFSIGAIRGSISLEKENLYFEPIEIEINSREDLDKIILTIHNNLVKIKSRCQMWFRGQTKEFYLPEVKPELYAKYCPWRNIKDISLVPSLFRDSDKINENLNDYAQKLEEIQMYESGLFNYLEIPPYDNIQSPFIDFTEYFKGTVWEDSNTPFYTTVSDQEGNFVERHDYNPVLRALQTSLFLQHYGIPTNILDITSDIDIALFFAQNSLNKENGIYEPIDNIEKSVIYIFLLDPITDRFINSAELLQEFNVQRPIRQKCGVLAGASYSSQNYYSRFISLKLKLKDVIDYNAQYTSDYIFPQQNQDKVLSFLLDLSKKYKMEVAQPT